MTETTAKSSFIFFKQLDANAQPTLPITKKIVKKVVVKTEPATNTKTTSQSKTTNQTTSSKAVVDRMNQQKPVQTGRAQSALPNTKKTVKKVVIKTEQQVDGKTTSQSKTTNQTTSSKAVVDRMNQQKPVQTGRAQPTLPTSKQVTQKAMLTVGGNRIINNQHNSLIGTETDKTEIDIKQTIPSIDLEKQDFNSLKELLFENQEARLKQITKVVENEKGIKESYSQINTDDLELKTLKAKIEEMTKQYNTMLKQINDNVKKHNNMTKQQKTNIYTYNNLTKKHNTYVNTINNLLKKENTIISNEDFKQLQNVLKDIDEQIASKQNEFASISSNQLGQK